MPPIRPSVNRRSREPTGPRAVAFDPVRASEELDEVADGNGPRERNGRRERNGGPPRNAPPPPDRNRPGDGDDDAKRTSDAIAVVPLTTATVHEDGIRHGSDPPKNVEVAIDALDDEDASAKVPVIVPEEP